MRSERRAKSLSPRFTLCTSFISRCVTRARSQSSSWHNKECRGEIWHGTEKNSEIDVPFVFRCTDSSILGTPFYVMEYLEGRIFTDVRMPELKTKEERTAWFVALFIFARRGR